MTLYDDVTLYDDATLLEHHDDATLLEHHHDRGNNGKKNMGEKKGKNVQIKQRMVIREIDVTSV